MKERPSSSAGADQAEELRLVTEQGAGIESADALPGQHIGGRTETVGSGDLLFRFVPQKQVQIGIVEDVQVQGRPLPSPAARKVGSRSRPISRRVFGICSPGCDAGGQLVELAQPLAGVQAMHLFPHQQGGRFTRHLGCPLGNGQRNRMRRGAGARRPRLASKSVRQRRYRMAASPLEICQSLRRNWTADAKLHRGSALVEKFARQSRRPQARCSRPSRTPGDPDQPRHGRVPGAIRRRPARNAQARHLAGREHHERTTAAQPFDAGAAKASGSERGGPSSERADQDERSRISGDRRQQSSWPMNFTSGRTAPRIWLARALPACERVVGEDGQRPRAGCAPGRPGST